MLFVFGLLIATLLWHKTIEKNTFLLSLKRPFTVAITGDSSSGKDTLAESLNFILMEKSTLNLSGDDYHKYDRHKALWKSVTHLNPIANNLNKLSSDFVKLRNGLTISKRVYDHKTGFLSPPKTVKSRNFIIISGLHAFMIETPNLKFDLKIFLDMDDQLRRYFKIRRDTLERDKSLEETLQTIEKRAKDFERFVRPQKENADIIFRVFTPSNLEKQIEPSKLKFCLDVEFKQGTVEDRLIRNLSGIYGCQVAPKNPSTRGFTRLVVDGYMASKTVELAAKRMFPKMSEFYQLKPTWEGGILGIMQLITLMFTCDAISNRNRHENN